MGQHGSARSSIGVVFAMSSRDFAIAQVGGHAGLVDLIFVHGLSGNMVTTWAISEGAPPHETYWPKWLATDLPWVNVYSLGYPTSFFESWANREMTLFERSKATLDYLASYEFGKKPIAFVTHSLGGLLIKQVLKTAHQAPDRGWRAIADNCKLVTFLATPHTGSCLASILQFTLPRVRPRTSSFYNRAAAN